MIGIALGANLPSDLGPPEVTLAAALRLMPEIGINVVKYSEFIETEPVPPSGQPNYINAVALVETTLSPGDLMESLLELEAQFGRIRTVRNAARTIDLDLLFYDDVIIDDEKLCLPHPRMTARLFVLQPLNEIAPDWRHPVLAKTAQELMLLHSVAEPGPYD